MLRNTFDPDDETSGGAHARKLFLRLQQGLEKLAERAFVEVSV